VGALHLGLVHGPVVNKRGDEITTAVTGLNVHDIARTAATYGVRGYFLVTPLEPQRRLVARITAHWRTGHGAAYNPTRKTALDLVRVTATLAEAIADVTAREGAAPRLVATSARPQPGVTPVTYADLRRDLATDPRPVLLVFGTGWGLAAAALAGVDALLPPLKGPGDYNHLPVRAAVAVVLDRLRGDGETAAGP
jgi:tRNA (guanine37-N1)-methyltransferase